MHTHMQHKEMEKRNNISWQALKKHTHKQQTFNEVDENISINLYCRLKVNEEYLCLSKILFVRSIE